MLAGTDGSTFTAGATPGTLQRNPLRYEDALRDKGATVIRDHSNSYRLARGESTMPAELRLDNGEPVGPGSWGANGARDASPSLILARTDRTVTVTPELGASRPWRVWTGVITCSRLHVTSAPSDLAVDDDG